MAAVQVILPAVLAVLWASNTQQILVVESLSSDLGNTAPGDAHDTRTGASRSLDLVSAATKTPNTNHSHLHIREKRQTGHITLQCSTTWLPLLHRYDISVIWNVTGTNLNTIQNFRLEWKKVKQGILYFYNFLTTLYPTLRVRTNNDNIYKSCNLDITPPIPGNVSNITATASTISHLNLGIFVSNISVQCQQPLVPRTAPENLKYQLGIGFNTPTKVKDLQANIRDNRTIHLNIIQSVSVHFPENGSLHNKQQVFIWLRSYYVATVDSETDATEQATVYSSWSSPVVLRDKQIELLSTTAANHIASHAVDKHFSTSQVGSTSQVESTSQIQKLATTHQPLASVPTPSFSPREDGLLSWHWIVIAVSIVVAIFLTFANIIGVILHGIFACKKPNKAAAIEKEMGMINISTDSTEVLKNDSF